MHAPPRGQLLKWIGSKQRFASQICANFPADVRCYYEPFVGSAAVCAAFSPQRAVASDVLEPLVVLWKTLCDAPNVLCHWYAERWNRLLDGDKVANYFEIRAEYNRTRDPADLLLLVRACYGGVVRFAKDGSMNTPCGVHRPIPPAEFDRRAEVWRARLAGVRFEHSDFEAMVDAAGAGDLVYCDPPYADSQNTLYGAQAFSLDRLLAAIDRAKVRGARVALSIDGTKRSGRKVCDVPMPAGLFVTDREIVVGRSMLRRFQLGGQTLEHEVVADRLLLTWRP
ncbi:MAG: DNA adenine methylase [Deltaproteobacteria bacterium]|nr:DNA adenine methylase [Deltaproteobacteria bacterium]